MPRYWVIAPVESKPPRLFDKVWEFDRDHNLISIGWSKLGDVSKMSREELVAAVASTYPEKPAGTRGLYVNMLRAFYDDISPGDFVIARRGRRTLVAVGEVIKPAIYAPGKSPVHAHPNYLEVKWLEKPRDKVFPLNVFPRHTLSGLSADKYRALLEGSGIQPVVSDTPEAIEDRNAPINAEIILEKYLEEFIVSNFETIFKGKYKIYEESEEVDGQQYRTEIGPIDILAIEPKAHSFVVIELKKGRPSDQVVGQILRYMGWVKMALCKDGQSVKGLIICHDPDPKLSYALEMTNNIDVRYYSASFKLGENPEC
jgi:restriction system protein